MTPGGFQGPIEEFDDYIYPNVAPSITSISASTSNIDPHIAILQLTLNDPGWNIEKIVINWGDGTTETKYAGQDFPKQSSSSMSVSFSHYYSSSGTYTITVTVYDSVNAKDTDSTTSR